MPMVPQISSRAARCSACFRRSQAVPDRGRVLDCGVRLAGGRVPAADRFFERGALLEADFPVVRGRGPVDLAEGFFVLANVPLQSLQQLLGVKG